MIKTYLTILSIVLIAITVTIGILKPEINKPIEFSVAEFKLTSAEQPVTKQETIIKDTENTETKILEKEITSENIEKTTKIIEQKPITTTKDIEVQPTKNTVKTTAKTVLTTPSKTETKTITPSKQPEPQKKEIQTELPKSVTDIVKNIPPTAQPEIKKDTVIEKDAPKVAQIPQKPVELPTVASKPIEQMTPDEIIKQAEKEDRFLTEREEVVVWNVWRSNLQNQIMQDTQISAPLGTAFKFSFTVDSKGRISNLRTWAIPSTYNSVAINYLKPLILSYSGKPILNFPSRTKRVITNVTGGFTISTEDKFSTPDDFSDIERIKTTR